MVKYKYDADTMIEKIRETWSPEDFLQATKNLMYTKKHSTNCFNCNYLQVKQIKTQHSIRKGAFLFVQKRRR